MANKNCLFLYRNEQSTSEPVREVWTCVCVCGSLKGAEHAASECEDACFQFSGAGLVEGGMFRGMPRMKAPAACHVFYLQQERR